ncbi:MAG: hypothetical protein KDA69_19695, partial [Planctomycetaceae bacterium]|nr:hypothetical protein [Planctomycetaceae bacterium]
MNADRVVPISLQYLPSPDGDNRLDVEVREGDTSVTYFASSRAEGGGRCITIHFKNCFAIRYVVTEDHESYCPGINDSESDFVEIHESSWVCSQPEYVQQMKHFAF